VILEDKIEQSAFEKWSFQSRFVFGSNSVMLLLFELFDTFPFA
jgi:hypothetical protein